MSYVRQGDIMVHSVDLGQLAAGSRLGSNSNQYDSMGTSMSESGEHYETLGRLRNPAGSCSSQRNQQSETLRDQKTYTRYIRPCGNFSDLNANNNGVAKVTNQQIPVQLRTLQKRGRTRPRCRKSHVICSFCLGIVVGIMTVSVCWLTIDKLKDNTIVCEFTEKVTDETEKDADDEVMASPSVQITTTTKQSQETTSRELGVNSTSSLSFFTSGVVQTSTLSSTSMATMTSSSDSAKVTPSISQIATNQTLPTKTGVTTLFSEIIKTTRESLTSSNVETIAETETPILSDTTKTIFPPKPTSAFETFPSSINASTTVIHQEATSVPLSTILSPINPSTSELAVGSSATICPPSSPMITRSSAFTSEWNQISSLKPSIGSSPSLGPTTTATFINTSPSTSGSTSPKHSVLTTPSIEPLPSATTFITTSPTSGALESSSPRTLYGTSTTPSLKPIATSITTYPPTGNSLASKATESSATTSVTFSASEPEMRSSSAFKSTSSPSSSSTAAAAATTTTTATTMTTASTTTTLTSTTESHVNIDRRSVQGGHVYVRWGSLTCPAHADILYKGYAAGGHWQHQGGATNTICLPEVPTWGNYSDNMDADRNLVYGSEYGSSDESFQATTGKKLKNKDVPCSVCMATGRPSHVMIPGKTKCFPGWSEEYRGYLMGSGYVQNHASELICVDSSPEQVPGGDAARGGNYLYFAEVRTGSLSSQNYANGRELSCVVCTL